MNLEYAPIALFTYRRRDHLRRVIDSLRNNELAAESILYVFSDGYRSEDDYKNVCEVRAFIRSIKGFKDVVVVERESNYGLAKNIIDGVTGVVAKHGRIIVLEDDIVTSRFFLQYMNDALELYEDADCVMEISGMAYPINKAGMPETVFLHYADCWGWATWERAWKLFEKNPKKLMKVFSRKDIYTFNLEGRVNRWKQVVYNRVGFLCTWAIFWDATIYLNNGLMLYPRDSLVSNIGLDSSGEHSAKANPFLTNPIEYRITEFPEEFTENKEIRNRMADYLMEVTREVEEGIVKKVFKRIRIIMTSTLKN